MNPWRGEYTRGAALLAVALLLGLLTGAWVVALSAAFALYLARHLIYANRLLRWLREGKSFQPPPATGVWEEIFTGIWRLRQRARKRKRKLAALLKRFQQATAALPDATVVLRAADTIEWWNPAAGRLLGLRWPQDQNQHIGNLLRHPEFAAFLAHPERAADLKLAAPHDESLSLRLRVVPYGDERRLLIAHDETLVRRLELVRRDFVANVSHELRTPLTVLAGFLETLAETDDLTDEEYQRSMTLMRQQTQRMQRLVNDLLLLARLEAGEQPVAAEPAAVPELLAQIEAEARALSAGRHRIEFDAAPGLALIGDAGELRSAFSNLIFNAVQYTPQGGRIAILWAPAADDEGARLTVSDSGIGIAAHHLPRLTERFYRIDAARSREGGGTGLGLAIVKHVLQRHDAELRVVSTPGQGSTFICEFPPARVVYRPEAPVSPAVVEAGAANAVLAFRAAPGR